MFYMFESLGNRSNTSLLYGYNTVKTRSSRSNWKVSQKNSIRVIHMIMLLYLLQDSNSINLVSVKETKAEDILNVYTVV